MNDGTLHFTVTIPGWVDIVVAFVASMVAAAVIWRAIAPVFDQPLFARTNHRGRNVPVGAGIVIFLTCSAVAAIWVLVDAAAGWSDLGGGGRAIAVMVAGGFGLLGLFDDLAASGDDRGFRGHLEALMRGRLTTGAVKLLGGGLLALVLATSTSGPVTFWRILLGGAVIALGANTANLFDRAPARCTKLALVCGVVVVATAGANADRVALPGLAMVLGAAAGLVAFDAREKLMLGDAGSNVLGAMLGWSVVATSGWQAQLAVLVVLVVVNLASEKVSFSRVIDANPALRAIDRIGRPDAEDPPHTT